MALKSAADAAQKEATVWLSQPDSPEAIQVACPQASRCCLQDAAAAKEAAEAKLRKLEDSAAESASGCADSAKQIQVLQSRVESSNVAVANAQDALRHSEDVMHGLERQKACHCLLLSQLAWGQT